jgi:MFS family permease
MTTTDTHTTDLHNTDLQNIAIPAPANEPDPAVLTSWRTGAAESGASEDAARVTRVTRFRRRVMAVTIGVGAALTFAGFATTNWEGTTEKADYLNSLTEAPVQSQIAAVLLHFGYMGFLPLLLALGAFARRRAVKLGHVGLGLGLVGALSLPGLLVTDFYDLAIGANLPIDQAVKVSDAAQGYGWAIALGGPTVLGVFVGMLLLLIAGWRSGFLGWYPAVALIAGIVVTGIAPQLVFAVVGSGLVAVAMTAVAVRVWRTTDEEWATSVPSGR